MKELEAKKREAKEAYKTARETWTKEPTETNWRQLCNAKRNCMLLGARI